TTAIKQQAAYWLERFGGELPKLELPLDYPRPEMQAFEGAELYFFLEESEISALKEIAMTNKVTMFMLLAALYNILLSRLSGTGDIIVGTPTAGRRHAALMQIVGMFVNTLALRNYPGANKTFLEFLAQLKENTLAAFENQDYQFETLVEELGVTRDTSRNPVFDVFFSFQDAGTNQPPKGEDETADHGKMIAREDRVAKFDITLNCIEEGSRLKVSFGYCRKLFEPETMERFAGYFKRIITAVLPDSATGNIRKLSKLADIEILSREEKHQLIYDYNNTAAQYPKDKTINQLFEEQVEKKPDRIAAVG
ncbi:MAG: non-ribosomal peptide synthetase, partial [bacterium]|nr:non-ribosomal peptide synthetase [bacterium]